MAEHPPPPAALPLRALLKRVSRSFYLSLRVLPAGMQEPVGLAYLLARAADSIADTAVLVPERRLECLLDLRAQLVEGREAARLARIVAAVTDGQADAHERTLVLSLGVALDALQRLDEADQQAVRKVLGTLLSGMEFDLRTFPSERAGSLVALDSLADLERYTYSIAGCVGEFWTEMATAHVPAVRGWNVTAMSQLGIRFGKALQLVNILRDCPADLRIGRCYLPRELLAPAGLSPEALRDPKRSAEARPVLDALAKHALAHFEDAARYTLAIPRRCMRLRLACLWPVLIGMRTLGALGRHPAWLDVERPIKIGRSAVYRLLVGSTVAAPFDTVVQRWLKNEAAHAAACFNHRTVF